MPVTRADQYRSALLEQLLEQQRHTELEDFVTQEWDKDLLGDALLNAARALRFTKAVIFLSTLGVANLEQSGDRAMWLVAYQSLAQGREAEGFDTLAPQLPIVWVVRQILQPGASTAVQQCQGEAIDWLDAMELSIDYLRLDLLEHITQHLGTQDLPANAWLVAAKTLIERARLLGASQDLARYAHCMERIRQQIDTDSEEYAKIRNALAAHAARSYLKVQDAESAKRMALAIEPDTAMMRLEHLTCMAEAHCKADELPASLGYLDKTLELALQPEILQSFKEEKQKKKKSKSKDSTFSSDAAGQALQALQEAVAPSGQKVFLVSGTLLGYAREGKVLGHDKDIDVGIVGWINQFDVLNAILSSRQFQVYIETFAKKETYVVPVLHIATGIAIDLFFYHPEGDKYVTGIQHMFGYLQRFAFTPFELQPIEFLGAQLYAPSDIELKLRENYGDSWRISDPDYISHLESPSTVGMGGLVHQLVGRLTVYSCLRKGQPSKMLRALSVLEQYQQHPGGMAPALMQRLRDLAGRLDELMAPDAAENPGTPDSTESPDTALAQGAYA
ncbi:hypothetical protein [Alicycliphilus denitrificans]|uniref:hypothetical protein n=1 Tax=Alicycliphilus denitrificans TaxID=179636 RepID=UPI00384E48CE